MLSWYLHSKSSNFLDNLPEKATASGVLSEAAQDVQSAEQPTDWKTLQFGNILLLPTFLPEGSFVHVNSKNRKRCLSRCHGLNRWLESHISDTSADVSGHM